MTKKIEDYSKQKLSVLRLFFGTVVDCEEHFSETKSMKKDELIKWFYKYISWHEIQYIPTIEEQICVKCMEVRKMNNYIYGKYDCPKCKGFIVLV